MNTTPNTNKILKKQPRHFLKHVGGFLLMAIIAAQACSSTSKTDASQGGEANAQPADDGKEYIQLQWRGAGSFDVKYATQRAIEDQKVGFGPIKDARRPGDPLGIRKKDNNPATIATRDDVIAFLNTNVKQRLSAAGFRDLPDNKKILSSELQRLYVEEEGTYQGYATFRFTLKKGAKTLWQGSIDGRSRRWGRTGSEDNYNETITNAVDSCFQKLLEDSAFVAALEK